MKHPIAVATWKFGRIGLDAAVPILESGGKAIDAVEKGINAIELDVQDQYFVGVGGYPNREGIMELDAAIMDHEFRYGAVLGLTDISCPISVAKLILQNCPHNVLVSDGALTWALEHGFQKTSILTREMEREYYEWKLSQLKEGDTSSLGPRQQLSSSSPDSDRDPENEPHDTIGMICLDQFGNLSAGTSTSGWKYKHPGRIGDSPLIGSGLYCDGEIGAAVATGDGEEIMRRCLCFLIVELIRNGMNVQDACVAGVKRILQLVPKCPSLDSMHPKLVIGVIAMDIHGNVGAASTIGLDEVHRDDHRSFPVPVWDALSASEGIRILEASIDGNAFYR